MKIINVVVGNMKVNCYIVANEETAQALVLDPGECADLITDALDKAQLSPVAILLTHAHFDHIGAVKEMKNKYNIPVYAGKYEEEGLMDGNTNMSLVYTEDGVTIKADVLLQNEDFVSVGGLSFRPIFTPGHTKGGTCYYFEDMKTLFSGDTLFKYCIGRSDLPGGNSDELLKSIKEKLLILPMDTKVYPGHGEPTTIEFEAKHNIFLRDVKKKDAE